MRARRLNRVVSRIYDEALREHDIRVTQLNVLVAVSVAGEVSPRQLGDMLDLEKSTLSRNLQRMKERGWLRQQPAEGAPGQRLTVTAEGQQLLQEVLPAWRAAQQRVQRLLGPEVAHALQQSDDALGWP
jgi:DNA-binding MarR family transcriptional regulator